MKDSVYEQFKSILGPENITRDPCTLDAYTYQWTGENSGDTTRMLPHRAECVTLPSSTEEVQAIVKLCNRHNLKIKAHSTGWGAFGAATSEGVVLLDLRRMNRLIELNEKDMYAVVEPYVIWAQLQTAAMKKGLNCATIGAGSGTSPLASCTSVQGLGYNNVSMGYNARSILGVEWVLPNGEILRLGSPGSGAGWISGDGPGPSLRGIMRGAIGAFGGFGVFTKCAVRLYHWGGPAEMPSRNIEIMEERLLEYPENIKLVAPYFENYVDMEEALARIGEEEIAYSLGLFGRGLMTIAISTDNRGGAEMRESMAPLLPKHSFILMMVGSSENELRHNQEVLDDILNETNGTKFDMVNQEEFKDVLTLTLVKGGNGPARAFSAAGNFAPVMCGLFPSRRTMARTMVETEEIKKRHMESGLIVDDLGEGGWGPLLIDHGHMEYYENETMYDPTVPESVQAVHHVIEEAHRHVLENKLSIPAWGMLDEAIAKGRSAHDALPSHMNADYSAWQRKFKAAFDPNSTSDATYHIEGGAHGGET